MPTDPISKPKKPSSSAGKKEPQKEGKTPRKEKKKVTKHYLEKQKGQKFFQSFQKISKPEYTLPEAVSLLKEIAYTKFDSTCEIHLNINSDPKHADQMVRGTIVLPHGTGKSPRIAAFVPEEKSKIAIAAGASKTGLEQLIEEVQQGKIDFDIAVAVPEVMKDIAKIAKILGQKGLMPNPKSGTVTTNLEKTIQEIKLGKVEFKLDKQAIIHSVFGKISFTADQLLANLKTLLKAIIDARPTGIKGNYIKSISISATMSPGIRINVNEAISTL
jgi:large subunit ribosomal protein L1